VTVDDLKELTFFVLNIDTLTTSLRVISIHDSLELQNPTAFAVSNRSLPVVDNKMFFFNGFPPFYIDLKTLLAHPLQLPPNYRNTLCKLTIVPLRERIKLTGLLTCCIRLLVDDSNRLLEEREDSFIRRYLYSFCQHLGELTPEIVFNPYISFL